jgi:SAM-dependent methyltransferase
MTSAATQQGRCRSCGAPLSTVFVDLGLSPISNAFVRQGSAHAGERIFPLKAFVCDACFLVQIEDVVGREAHFHQEYAYFSSYSTSWMAHARKYAEMAIERFGLGAKSVAIEVASNDGYLLRHFVERGIQCFGIDPAANCAEAALKVGVMTKVGFFGADMARRLAYSGRHADLMTANNVLAHVPDINDFVAGFAILLKPEGTITFEFPHLLKLIAGNQFDTIYHEHYSYLSMTALRPLLARHALAAYDVEILPTHGGSLRVFVGHVGAERGESAALAALIAEEQSAGLRDRAAYLAFHEAVRRTKRKLLQCLIALKESGARICAYGAPAKGTTLLNYCGIGTDFIDFTVDQSFEKQQRTVPGTTISILEPEAIRSAKPDFVLILPWNLSEELMIHLDYIREWGGRFILPIPEPLVVP